MHIDIPDSDFEAPDSRLGPHAVDQMVRQALSMCWMLLPKERRNVLTAAAEFQRIVDRVLNNLKEDAKVFGESPGSKQAD